MKIKVLVIIFAMSIAVVPALARDGWVSMILVLARDDNGNLTDYQLS